jgi:hypothetical protein
MRRAGTGSAGVSPGVSVSKLLAPEGRFGVRQLAAAFDMFVTDPAKAQASLRIPKK